MTFLQALLIGIFAYLGSKRTPWFFGVTGGWNMIGRPLVAGLIVGVILGDVRGGVIAGAMVQALFIGQITPGGAMPADVNWAAYIGIPLALAAGGTGEQAVALSVPLSMLGLGLFNFIMTINAYFPHMGDLAAEKGDGAGIHRATYLAAVPSFILRAGSAMLICYLGSKKWMLVLFLMGWILIGSTNMSVTALAVFATAIAFIFVMAQGGTQAAVPAPVQSTEEDGCYEE